MKTTKVKVVLQKSFEFNLTELNGKTLDEQVENAVKLARARLTSSLRSKVARGLLENRVIIT